MLNRKRAAEKAMGQRATSDGALSIQPFEGSRVTTLWDLNRVSRAGWESGAGERRGVGTAKQVMEVWMGLDRKRWRGCERVSRARRGTRRALRVLSVQGVSARVS